VTISGRVVPTPVDFFYVCPSQSVYGFSKMRRRNGAGGTGEQRNVCSLTGFLSQQNISVIPTLVDVLIYVCHSLRFYNIRHDGASNTGDSFGCVSQMNF